jgi:peptidyl-prolyl cis-trans isomerase B (cyclophilin B)
MALAFWAGCGCSKSEAPTAKSQGEEASVAQTNPTVVMETSLGTIKIELWADKAPATVENFLRYADEGYYDGTIFHRVISNFMIQGGGFASDMSQKRAGKPIRNEARADLKNVRGALAMARTSDIHSATAQFFISVTDNKFLDHRDETPGGFGYAAFGKVVEGMDVVDEIRYVKTATRDGYDDVPVTPVVIQKVRRAAQ